MYINQGYKNDNEWWKYLITFIFTVVAILFSEAPLSLIANSKASEQGGKVLDYMNADMLEITDIQF